MPEKVVLAYSGGLDTSIIIPWLKENYDCEVIAMVGDVGQGDDLNEVTQKARRTGASEVVVEDLREKFVTDYVFPTLRAGAVYENRYLLGTSMARPVLAKAQVEVARRFGATAVSHGCTGKGNDQVRFELAYQALADYFTLQEKFGDLKPLKLAFVGDGNNVAHSLLLTAARLGSRIAVATPPGYEPDAEIVQEASTLAAQTGGAVALTYDAEEAVAGADAVYTDVWASMGQEGEADERRGIFAPYQVNEELMARAAPHAVFLHCLPAHRGEEVTNAVIDSSRSAVFDQAENRLHVQKAILLLLMGNGGRRNRSANA